MMKFVFGLDFGTSKTAMFRSRCGTAMPEVQHVQVDPMDLPALGKRTATCVLYEPDGTIHIGTPAAREFLQRYHAGQAATLRLESNFKPRLPTDDRAVLLSEEFLTKLIETDCVKCKIEQSGTDAVTVVGRPSGWDDQAANRLLEVVRRSGYPNPICLPEPVGALMHHLGQLHTTDLKREILVVDWGAGTIDFSVMRDGHLDHERGWGSNIYGGQLFDDLFYQWVLETRLQEPPAVRAELEATLRSSACHSHLRDITSREVKESFSEWWTRFERGMEKPFKVEIEIDDVNLGTFKLKGHDALQQFEARARQYQPSPERQSYLFESSENTSELDAEFVNKLRSGEPIDLLAWGEALMRKALGELRTDTPICILTGGSTLWPWFRHLVSRICAKIDVRTDSEPEVTIAKGLSKAYVVGDYAGKVLQVLNGKQEFLIQELADDFLSKEYERFKSTLIQKMLTDCESAYKAALRMMTQGDRKKGQSKISSATDTWLLSPSSDFIRVDINEINGRAVTHVEYLLRKHDVRIEGLLQAASIVATPITRTDWSDEIRNAARKSVDWPVWKWLWHVAGAAIADLFKTKEEAQSRISKLVDQEYATFKAKVAAEFDDVLRRTFPPRQWSRGVLAMLKANLQSVVELVTPSAADSDSSDAKDSESMRPLATRNAYITDLSGSNWSMAEINGR